MNTCPETDKIKLKRNNDEERAAESGILSSKYSYRDPVQVVAQRDRGAHWFYFTLVIHDLVDVVSFKFLSARSNEHEVGARIRSSLWQAYPTGSSRQRLEQLGEEDRASRRHSRCKR